MSSISHLLPSTSLPSVLGTILTGTGLASKAANSILSGASSSPTTDNSQLSPFAQVLNQLQQLQQTDPAKYAQVTQQIATNLQSAAQTATTDGNTTAASQLTQLSSDFSTASQSGQIPKIQDLAQAIGGHHHHHRAQPAATTAGQTDSDSSGGNNSAISQFLAALQANSAAGTTPNASFDPTSIILSTLSSAGVTAS
jgi:hypothetical protein